jgi:voltage-gated sodium channel
MNNFCLKISDNEDFQTFILFLILIVAGSMGLETIPQLADDFGEFFLGVHFTAQVIFVLEIIVRVGAHAPRFKAFFNSKWNVFDFVIVLSSFMPGVGGFALIGRLVRVLRVTRVFSVSQHLRGFIQRLSCTLDEIFYVALIIAIIGYIFTLAGHYLFIEIDPQHWGSLRDSALTVFHLMLFQDVRKYTDPLSTASLGYMMYFLLFYFSLVSLFFSTLVAAISQEIVSETDNEN